MEHGFPLTHPRFVSTTVAPVTLVLAGLAGLLYAAVRRDAVVSRVAVGALILSGCATGLALFGTAVLFPVVVFAPAAAAFLVSARDGFPRNRAASLGAALLATVIGASAAWGLRAPDPSTQPRGSGPEGGGPAGAVEVLCGTLRLNVDPRLHFTQASRSRFWSAWSPDDARDSLGPATMVTSTDAGVTLIDSTRTLSEPVFAHLDAFARIEVWRARQLRVRIAEGTAPVEVVPSDYPSGRPLHFLAWDGELLRAYEASSAEKGPFRELVRTPLRRGDPLVLELLDGDVSQCRVTLLDFTAQASTELSPTAGYGLPQNAIELHTSDQAPAYWLHFSLAATSIGRGFDVVGHAPGTYRNRIRVE